jgi:galacturan 1,4-alpha-galacturonidase
MFCNGSHGISVGSLGQYPGEYDIVENIYVYNTSMHNASVSLLCPFAPALIANV